jgi:hypothetical protein
MSRRLITLHIRLRQALTATRRDAGLATVEWLYLAVGLVIAATAAIIFYQNKIQSNLSGL